MRDSLARKISILLAIIVLLSASLYLLFNNVSNTNHELTTTIGDPPAEETTPIILGGAVNKPLSNGLSIAGIQTAYIQYTKEKITFEQMIQYEIQYLKDLLVVPTLAEDGYLTSVGYSTLSATQIYFHSNKEHTRTIILKVVSDKKENTVSIIYDGGYYKIVDVNSNGKSLSAYNIDSTKVIIEVN